MSAAKPGPSEHSRITVGIVTHNSAAHIYACLESIATNLADAIPTIIILDNASSDDTISVIGELRKKYRFPPHIMAQTMNRGYAWGANRICELVRTEWLCLINPDARLLTPAFVATNQLVKWRPTCGVIGGIIVDPYGRPQECGGAFPTPLMAVWDWCGLRHVFPRPRWSTTVRLNLRPDASPRPIDYPTGAFWMMRREVWQRVGPFDERFFLYFEDTDFCKRAKEKGWPSFVHPAIHVAHQRGASLADRAGPDGRDPLSIYFQSLVKYLNKHFPQSQVDLALRSIHAALRLRKWLRKDEKSELILRAFESGTGF